MSLKEKPTTSEQAALHTKLKPCKFSKSVHLNVSFVKCEYNFWQSKSILGNVGTRFGQDKRHQSKQLALPLENSLSFF